MPPNFSHQVSFLRRQFSLYEFFFSARLFFGTTVFFGTTFCFRQFFWLVGGTTFCFRQFFWLVGGTTFCFRHHFFATRPGQVTADQYYCSSMEHMVVAGGGGNPMYGLYRYVPRNRVWFLRFSVLKQGMFFYPSVSVSWL